MSGSTHVFSCLNDLRSTISVSCWLLYVVLAAVTNGQNNLLESSNASCCECCSRAQGSAARPWHHTGSREGPDGGSEPHFRSSLIPEKI